MTNPLLKNGNKVNFTLHDVKIYATNKFNAVTIIAVTNYRAVRAFNVDPNVLYNACVPYIPNGISTKVEDWEFIVVDAGTPTFIVIPIPAIQSNSIVLAKPGKLTITIENVQSEDIEKIIHSINSLGYDQIESHNS